MTRSIVKLLLSLLAAFAAGCASMGTGFGSTGSSATPVNFSFQSLDAVSGSTNATVPDDEPPSGKFF